jgi:hypothetical protein
VRRPADAPSDVAVPDGPQVGAPWIEPGWLVLPLVLVPLLAVGALVLLRRLVPPPARHRRL